MAGLCLPVKLSGCPAVGEVLGVMPVTATWAKQTLTLHVLVRPLTYALLSWNKGWTVLHIDLSGEWSQKWLEAAGMRLCQHSRHTNAHTHHHTSTHRALTESETCVARHVITFSSTHTNFLLQWCAHSISFKRLSFRISFFCFLDLGFFLSHLDGFNLLLHAVTLLLLL